MMNRKIDSDYPISNNFNDNPNHYEEIDEKTWYEQFFIKFQIEGIAYRLIGDLRQKGGLMSTRLFVVKDPWNHKEIGYGVKWDWKNKKPIYFRFGSDSDWTEFNNRFAWQFAGDNS